MNHIEQEPNQIWLQKELLLYKDLLKKVERTIKVEVFLPKESIISYHKPLQKLYFLVQGKAKIYMLHENGKSSLIQFLQKGDWIGELTLLEIEKQQKEVIAINECTCLSIPMDVAKKELLTESEFLLFLNRYLGKKLLKRTEFFARNQNYELKNRLASYILLTECDGIYREKHTETAEFLGISYRHLLYTLKKLQDENYIYKSKHGYKIEAEKLKYLARDQ